MSEVELTEQVDLAGESADVDLSAAIDARTFIPWLRLFDSFGEFKLQIDETGLSVRVVDGATICMVESTLPSKAFDNFDISGQTTLGINRNALAGAVSFARYSKSNSDTIRLVHDDLGRLTVRVERDVSGVPIEGESTLSLLDPDSIRARPDIPDLDLTATADLPASAFSTLLYEFRENDYIRITQNESELVFEWDGDTDDNTLTATIDGSGTSDSLFSVAYLNDLRTSVTGSLADAVTINTGEEFPIEVHIKRDGIYSAMWMQAPRIESGDRT